MRAAATGPLRMNWTPAAGSSTIRFDDITTQSGVQFITDSSPTPNKNQPETMVGGIGLIDYDNDGYLDIFFVNGAAIPSLKKESPKFYNRLYHNNRDGTFTDVTDKAGLAGDGYDMGVAVGDFDNDGLPDIFVASVTKNRLYATTATARSLTSPTRPASECPCTRARRCGAQQPVGLITTTTANSTCSFPTTVAGM